MDKISVVFTKRTSFISWLIRWGLPRSRLAIAQSSHCLILDGDYCIEAHMLLGVSKRPKDIAMRGLEVVASVDYEVKNSEQGLNWARNQVGKKYD